MKKCFSHSKCHLLIIATTISLLSGCGGNDDSDDKKVNPQIPSSQLVKSLIAIDGFSTVKPDTPTTIDMSPFMLGDSVKIASIDSIDPNSDCGSPSTNGTEVNVNIPNGSYCEYQYTAQKIDSPQAVARLNVLATNALTPMLPPISKALVLGSNPVSFDLSVLLGSDWKSTYSLNVDSVKVQGMEGNLGTQTSSGNIISFSPPELSGWNRIIYTISDSESAGSNMMGVIYVTISEEINQPPTIGLIKYDYNKYNPSMSIVANTETPPKAATQINLETLPNLNIKEPDGQDWQLISVQSFTASVSPVDANSVTNKAFNFTTSVIGDHIISYVIADHFGGYSYGLIKINVIANEKSVTWTDIISNGNTFTAPLTYSQGKNSGVAVSAQWDSAADNTVAGFNQNSANLYCSTIGALPTESSIELLRNNSLTQDNLHKWPKQKQYLIQTGDLFSGYDLTTGTVHPFNASLPYYVTCIKNRSLALNMLTHTVVANNARVPIAKVTVPHTTTNLILSDVSGTLTESQVNLLQDKIDDAIVDITTQSTKAGTYRFKVLEADNTLNSLTSGEINYIGDKGTGRFAANTGLVITKNEAAADGVDVDSLMATLTDTYGNPISGEKINVILQEPSATNNSSAKFATDPPNAITNAEGKVKIDVTNTEVEPITITTTYTASVSGESSAVKTVDFTGLTASEGYPCSDGGFECIPVASGNGYMLASSPSQQTATVLKLVQGVDYNKDVRMGQYQVPGLNVTGFTYIQAKNYCKKLSSIRFNGRTNWALIADNGNTDAQAAYKLISDNNLYMNKGWPWQFPSSVNFEENRDSFHVLSPWANGDNDGGFASWGLIITGSASTDGYINFTVIRHDVGLPFNTEGSISDKVTLPSACLSAPQ
ncbi:Ig-like domain-containing protein [Photobacterium damselae]